jgi:GntR family transcriptional regulator
VRRLASDRFARRHRKEGKAAFIAESEQVGATPEVDMLRVREAPAEPDVAGRLKLPDGTPVVVRSRRYSLDGQPVETATSYLPADIASGTPIADPNPGPGGIYARLEDIGHTLERFTEEVHARMPTPEEAKVLKLAPGVPVFRLIRTAYDADGRAVEVCDTIMAANAYVLSYDLPAH